MTRLGRDLAALRRRTPARLGGIDAFRGCAVLGMLLVHAERVFPPGAGASSEPWRLLLQHCEPFVSACFLFLVGLSLTLAWDRFRGDTDRSGFYRRGWRRAGVLYVAGVALFVLQYGLQLPDALLSPDILSAIALAIVGVGALIPQRPLVLWSSWAGVLGISWALDSAQLGLSGLNAGPGGSVPLVAFACAGAAWGLVRRAHSEMRVVALVGVALLVSVLAWGLPGEITTEYASVYALGATNELTTVWFWNHTPKGVLVLSGPLALCGLSFTTLPKLWSSSWVSPVRLLGRHALVVYVGHLLALGALDRWLRPTLGTVPLSTAMLMLMLVASCCAVALLLESVAGQPLKRRFLRRVGTRL